MKKMIAVSAGLFLTASVGIASAASFADVAFVIDQSGSMRGEFAWLGTSIASIDSGLTAGGITANYGVAGYERTAGFADSRNAWQDITGGITDVIDEVNAVTVYGGTENHYHAADWAADNFNWTAPEYAKVMVLITDERGDNLSSYSYGGLTGEAALGQKMSDENILLNVITFQNYYSVWDDAVFTNGAYSGLFDLDFLRNDPEGFTTAFTAAKLQEIIIVGPPAEPPTGVPEPATMLLFGTGLAGLVGSRIRRKKSNS